MPHLKQMFPLARIGIARSMSRNRLRLVTAVILMGLVVPAALAQEKTASGPSVSVSPDEVRFQPHRPDPDIALLTPPVLPRMSVELALQVLVRRYQEQDFRLLSYSDDTLMKAELPDYKQRGEYELKRQYSAPNSLHFTPVRYTGDGFVKNNVMVRLLQSEVDHVAKREGADTAITDANYKFSHKSVDTINGRLLYIFHVKPRKRRAGLFKGKIYVDPYFGKLVRAEGEVNSPSLFIKKLEFVQEYADVEGFSLPTHLHSVARVRVIGRTIVDIFHRGYQARAASMEQGSDTVDTAEKRGSGGHK
jgi:hypothetical protein